MMIEIISELRRRRTDTFTTDARCRKLLQLTALSQHAAFIATKLSSPILEPNLQHSTLHATSRHVKPSTRNSFTERAFRRTCCLEQSPPDHFIAPINTAYLSLQTPPKNNYSRQYTIARTCQRSWTLQYTVSRKNEPCSIPCITSKNIGRFLKFFHCYNFHEICNAIFTKYPTSPKTSRYTTAWNISIGK